MFGFHLIFIKLHLSLDSSSWTTATTWHMCTGQVTTEIPLLFWHEISHPICTAIVMCGSLRTMGIPSPTLRTCSRYLVAATHMHESTCFIHLLWTTAGLVDNTIGYLHLEMTSVLFVCLLFFHDHLRKLRKNLNSLHKKLNSWAISYLYTPGPTFSNVLKLFGWHKSLCIFSENMLQSFESWQLLALYLKNIKRAAFNCKQIIVSRIAFGTW